MLENLHIIPFLPKVANLLPNLPKIKKELEECSRNLLQNCKETRAQIEEFRENSFESIFCYLDVNPIKLHDGFAAAATNIANS